MGARKAAAERVTLPKVDIHVHLEGAIRPATLLELAERDGTPLPTGLLGGSWSFAGFEDFIAQYDALDACLGELEDLRRFAYELCADEAAEGVRYAEVTFTISSHARRLGDWHGPIEAVLDGFASGRRDFGVECQLVLDIARGGDMALAAPTTEAAVFYAGRGVVALGLGGKEAARPAWAFRAMFERARSAGLHAVPHAGEVCGPDAIRECLEATGADRIGHGIRCLDDPSLVDELRDRRVPLEVCLTSNLRTGAVPSLAAHPLPELISAGLVVTLNSDDPAMFGSPLADEYELACQQFGLGGTDLAAIALAGVDASFAPAALKAEIAAAVREWLAAVGLGTRAEPS
jgi:adenosine deaminase